AESTPAGEAYQCGVKRYQATYRYQLVTTTDFLTMAQQVARRDLSPLFSAWFATLAQPEGG
ncbi:MAG: hypothetical protein P8Y53_15000, partial [Pseudolabrys sp.]